MRFHQYWLASSVLTSTFAQSDAAAYLLSLEPTAAPVSDMPSLTTTIFTTAVTLTSFVTITTAQAMQTDIISAVQRLSQCSQSEIFPCIADSPCKVTDKACTCDLFVKLGVTNKISQKCTAADVTDYNKWIADYCSVKPPPVFSTIPPPPKNMTTPAPPPPVSTPAPPPPVSTPAPPPPVSTPAPPPPVSTPAPPPPVSTPAPPPPVSTPALPPPPPKNATTPAPPPPVSTPAPPPPPPAVETTTRLITSTATIVRTSNGVATTILVPTVVPGGGGQGGQAGSGGSGSSSTAPAPAPPTFTGGAAAEYGSVQTGLFVGALGLMGGVFAWL